MRHAAKAAKWVLTVLGGLLLLVVLLVAGVVGGSATGLGRAEIERLGPALSGGTVRIDGLSGWLFGSSRIDRLEVTDAHGPWLTIDGLTLDWAPLRLFSGTVMVQRLAADRVVVARRPEYPPSSSTGNSITLPVQVDLAALHIARLDLAAPVIGADAGVAASSLVVDGAARLEAIDRGTVRLDVRRLGTPDQTHAGQTHAGQTQAGQTQTEQNGANPGAIGPNETAAGTAFYTVDATLGPAGLHAALHLSEPAAGLIGSVAALPAIGAITVDATLDGPLSAIATKAALTAGPLQARLNGQVDATGEAADLQVSAEAPAMAPRPDLSWRDITLNGHVHGPFTKPNASATLVADGLALGQAGIGRVTADVQGDAGHLALDGAIDGIHLPGPQPDVLAAAPLKLTAAMRLDAATRPLTFTLQHPLFTIDGTAATAGEPHGEMQVSVPEVAPLARAGGIDVAGRVALTLRAARQGTDTQLEANGTVGVTSAPGPAEKLFGQDTKLDVVATVHDQTVRLSRLEIGSGAFSAGVTGTVAPGALDLHWHVAVADLAAVNPTVTGPFSATGKATGSPDNLAVSADLTGKVGAPGIAPGEVTAQVALAGLPNAPTGHVTAHGMLFGAPLDLAIAAARAKDPQQPDAVRVAIERADWKSAHAEGTLLVDPAALPPQGHITFAMTRLDDLQPLLGRALSGAVSGKLDSSDAGAVLSVTATGAGLPGTASVARATLDAKVQDPMTHPTLDGSLALEGIATQGVSGAARIEAKGPLDSVALRLTATLPALAGAPASIDAAGTVDAETRTATVASLQADWKQAPIRLLAPARISLADGVSVAGLRVGLRQAVLEANGRISPALNLTVRLSNVPANLAALADPALTLEGTLDAAAKLTGNPGRPDGTIQVTARGLRPASGPARAVPAANLTATATLRGEAARLDLRASAGRNQVTLTGTVPLGAAGPLDLHASGQADLAVTDPLLTPAGQRARGKITLDATATGSVAAPRVSGIVQLTGGSFRDFAQGIDLEAIDASLVADGGALRLTRLSAKAGPGTISASGSLDLTAPDRPLDLTLTAHNARPLASDLLTASMNADLTIRGNLSGPLTLGGRLVVQRADIRVPDRLPTSVPTLDVRIAGAPLPPPPAPGPDLALDLTVDAPEQIFVRGRGVDAELGGSVRLRGSAARPIPSGGFTLRQGEFSLAGQSLTFTTGKVSFDGGSLTDPSLDFTATTTAGSVTATLAITGTASKPKITLSSVPSLPQDEVLAYLLYGQRSASLGPLQVAQIAATLASLAGAGPTVANPLESLRGALGLDRLTMGAGSSLEAGRYVARNVYVGAKQSVTGTGTQAVVQVDLAKGLKLQATAGSSTTPSATGAAGSSDGASVGVIYQFQY
jgi:translocation and assembly module TamB